MSLFGRKKDEGVPKEDPFANDPAFNPQNDQFGLDPSQDPSFNNLQGQQQEQDDPFSSGLPPMGQPMHMNTDTIRAPPMQHTAMHQQPQTPSNNLEKDLALIIAKIDAIKSEVDAINMRLMKLERHLEQQPPVEPKKFANVY